jgi:hypothetical protein
LQVKRQARQIRVIVGQERQRDRLPKVKTGSSVYAGESNRRLLKNQKKSRLKNPMLAQICSIS